MRSLLAAGLLLLGASQVSAQDSLRVWVPQVVPHVVVWDSLSMNRISILAFGMHNEILTCFSGRVVGDTAYLGGNMVMPWHDESDDGHVNADVCPSGSLVVWHNHTWTTADSLMGFEDYRQMCGLSFPDMVSTAMENIAFAAVAVGVGTDTTVLCWWTQDQVRQGVVEYVAHLAPHLQAIEGQRLYLIRPGSED